jgi:type III secretion system FlhB-like substrate exporter
VDQARQPKKVVGLKYEPAAGLPQLVVKGSGPAAQEILRRRDALGGPVIEDAALVEQLYRLPMDARIGPELFELVAALLAHVFLLEQQTEGEAP